MTDDMIEAVARAIEKASCPHREGPFGGYDYGHDGEPPEGGRYVIRDFRDPINDNWGAWLHQTNDCDEHIKKFREMTENHIARAAIRAAAPLILDMAADVVDDAEYAGFVRQLKERFQ